jgi:hypothetical protein
VTVWREEGFGALYKGFVPKVLRLGPGGGVLLLVVEATLSIFRQGQFRYFELVHVLMGCLHLLQL